MPPLCGGACASSKPKRRAGQIYERTFWKWDAGGCGSPTATGLRNSASALASPSLIARSRKAGAMREIVIVAVACFLIGIMASALIVQLVP
jgi:hypothetical protein